MKPVLTRRVALQATALTGASLLAPRLVAAPTRDVPWLSEIQQPPKTLPPDAPKLSDLLVDESGRKITTLDAWNRRRPELRQWWLDFLGPFPAERRAAAKLTVLEEDRPEGVVRQLVRYEAEPGLNT